MIDAHTKREIERQELDVRLGADIIDYGDEIGITEDGLNLYDTDLARIMMHHLNVGKRMPYIFGNHVSAQQLKLESFFYEKLLPKIEKFSRLPEESNAMISRLLARITNAMMNRFAYALQRKEFEDPQTIFHAPNAMAEVPMKESLSTVGT